MTVIAVGTGDGLHELEVAAGADGVTARGRVQLRGHEITTVVADPTGWWAVADESSVWHAVHGVWEQVATLGELRARCLLPSRAGLLVGTSAAHLFRLDDGWLEPVESFEHVAGREAWFTPWGGPPDVRSLAEDSDGALYANVHVGGVPRSTDGGGRWEPTIDIHADVHQVLAGPSGWLLAATARGLAASLDGGDSWTFETGGLHGIYLRAVAAVGDSVLVTASTGPATSRAAIYRGRARQLGPLERCRDGLPEWFSDNIDTHCLAAAGTVATFGVREGQVYLSADEGRSWRLAAEGLAAVRCVALSPEPLAGAGRGQALRP